ncbi:MAG: tetratricopeptide repeat protein, partial [Candidatus Obscuribacterales bacterium]|nr:tetratricopeptide repeat protein [Candidatus Obscuribacterales bacterium]
LMTARSLMLAATLVSLFIPPAHGQFSSGGAPKDELIIDQNPDKNELDNKARQVYKGVLEEVESVSGTTSEFNSIVRKLGDTLTFYKRYQKAEAILLRALELSQGPYGRREDQMFCLGELGQLYLRQGKLDKAFEHATRTVELTRSMPDDYCKLNPNIYSSNLTLLGKVEMEKKDYENAEKHMRLALQVLLEDDKSDIHNKAFQTYWLGEILARRKKFEEAAELYQDKIKLVKQQLEPTHGTVRYLYMRYSNMFRDAGQIERADRIWNRFVKEYDQYTKQSSQKTSSDHLKKKEKEPDSSN